jgi:hypothetical protein
MLTTFFAASIGNGVASLRLKMEGVESITDIDPNQAHDLRDKYITAFDLCEKFTGTAGTFYGIVCVVHVLMIILISYMAAATYAMVSTFTLIEEFIFVGVYLCPLILSNMAAQRVLDEDNDLINILSKKHFECQQLIINEKIGFGKMGVDGSAKYSSRLYIVVRINKFKHKHEIRF